MMAMNMPISLQTKALTNCPKVLTKVIKNPPNPTTDFNDVKSDFSDKNPDFDDKKRPAHEPNVNR